MAETPSASLGAPLRAVLLCSCQLLPTGFCVWADNLGCLRGGQYWISRFAEWLDWYGLVRDTSRCRIPSYTIVYDKTEWMC